LVADAPEGDFVDADKGGAHLAIGGHGATGIAQPVQFQPDAGGVVLGQHDLRRAGVDDKADRHVIEVEGEVVMPIAAARDGDLVGRGADVLGLVGGGARDVFPQTDGRDKAHKDQPPDRGILQGLVHIQAVLGKEPTGDHQQEQDQVDQAVGRDMFHGAGSCAAMLI